MVRAAEANISQGVSLLQILRRAEQHGRGDNSVRAKTGPAAKIGCPPVRPATHEAGTLRGVASRGQVALQSATYSRSVPNKMPMLS